MKCGPLTFLAVHFNTSIMQQHNFMDEGQSQARPFRFRRIERQEDFADPVLWDAAARIVHSYFDLSSGSTKRPLTHGNRQTAVSRHRLQSILNEISHGL